MALVIFFTAIAGLLAFPLGFGDAAYIVQLIGILAMPFVGIVAGLWTRRPALALGSGAATVVGLAAAWALARTVDLSRPEGDMILVAWAQLAIIVAACHLIAAAFASRPRELVAEDAP